MNSFQKFEQHLAFSFGQTHQQLRLELSDARQRTVEPGLASRGKF
jgi:hypothetical protein